jgi:hypothetical protein
MKQLDMRASIAISCLLTFCFILAACGSGNSATRKIVPSPTPVVNLTSIKGNGYTIASPAGWISKKQTINGNSSMLQLSRSTDALASLIIYVLPNASTISAADDAQFALTGFQGTLKNFQEKSVPATVTIGSIQWDQRAATADDPMLGASSTTYILATNFPGNANKLVTIMYTAKTSEFDQVNRDYFQPMIRSFKFV